jgi:hypothetical protein
MKQDMVGGRGVQGGRVGWGRESTRSKRWLRRGEYKEQEMVWEGGVQKARDGWGRGVQGAREVGGGGSTRSKRWWGEYKEQEMVGVRGSTRTQIGLGGKESTRIQRWVREGGNPRSQREMGRMSTVHGARYGWWRGSTMGGRWDRILLNRKTYLIN